MKRFFLLPNADWSNTLQLKTKEVFISRQNMDDAVDHESRN